MTTFTFPQANERRNSSAAVVPDFQLGTVLILAANWLDVAASVLGPDHDQDEASGHWLDVWRCAHPDMQRVIRRICAEQGTPLPPGAE